MAARSQILLALGIVGCGASTPAYPPYEPGTPVEDAGAENDPQLNVETGAPWHPAETCSPIASRGKPVTIEVKTSPQPTNLTPDGIVAVGTYALTSHVSYIAVDAAVGPPMTYAMTLEVTTERFAILREEAGTTTTMGNYDLVPIMPEEPVFELYRTCGTGPLEYRLVTLHPTASGFDLRMKFPTGAAAVLHFEAAP